MDIAANSLRFAPDDETDLRMRLEPLHTIHNMHAFIFKFPGPFNVVLFIESSFELNQHRNLLAVDASCHQRIDNG